MQQRNPPIWSDESPFHTEDDTSFLNGTAQEILVPELQKEPQTSPNQARMTTAKHGIPSPFSSTETFSGTLLKGGQVTHAQSANATELEKVNSVATPAQSDCNPSLLAPDTVALLHSISGVIQATSTLMNEIETLKNTPYDPSSVISSQELIRRLMSRKRSLSGSLRPSPHLHSLALSSSQVYHNSDDDRGAEPVARDPARRSFRQRNKINYNVLDSYQSILNSAEDRIFEEDATVGIRDSKTLLPPFSSINMNIRTPDHLRQRLISNRDRAALASDVRKLFRPPVRRRTPGTDSVAQVKRGSIEFSRPYLRKNELASVLGIRTAANLAAPWDGATCHVDFTRGETESVFTTLRRLAPTLPEGGSDCIADILEGLDTAHIHQLSWDISTNGTLTTRSRDSIENFLFDLKCGAGTNKSARLYRLHLKSGSKQDTTLSTRLRQRELNMSHNESIFEAIESTLGPVATFTGTSGDVTCVAWHPNGNMFAVGSAALTDENSMQYNDSHNLLLGDFSARTLREFPNHAIERPWVEQGPNAMSSMRQSQDPLVFTTISHVQFTPDGNFFFSAGYDKCARMWHIPNSHSMHGARCIRNFKLLNKVDVLAVNSTGLWATGSSMTLDGSVRVLRYGIDVLQGGDDAAFRKCAFTSPRAKAASRISDSTPSVGPTCLKWGHTTYGQDRYLLGGFSHPLSSMQPAGEVCVWDVDAEKTTIAISLRNVFDLAWCPSTYGRLAVGCTIQGGAQRGMKSAVRIYDSRRLGSGDMEINQASKMELECPAKDINDILFCPSDPYLMSAACTDGTVYMWDMRNPDNLLQRFAHGDPLHQLYDDDLREDVDTGVRFLAWSGRSIYSGSSDGIVHAWSPYLAPEDAHIRQVAQLKSGIMAASFSPDFSSLLLGEVSGSVSIFSVTENAAETEPERFILEEATNEKQRLRRKFDKSIKLSRPGATRSRELLETKVIKIRPFGDGAFPRGQACQGREYSGPYDRSCSAPELRKRAEIFQLRFLPPRNPCPIKHEHHLLTEEQEGEDQRGSRTASATRIPWAVRRDRSTKLECLTLSCDGRLAALEDEEGFTDIVECDSCGLAWHVDVLGYSPLQRPHPASLSSAREADQLLKNLSHEIVERVTPSIVRTTPTKALETFRNQANESMALREEARRKDEADSKLVSTKLRAGRKLRELQRFARVGECYQSLWGDEALPVDRFQSFDERGYSDGECDFSELEHSLSTPDTA